MVRTEKKWMYVSFALMGIISLTAILPEAGATATQTLEQAFDMIADLQNQIDSNGAVDRVQQAEINQLEKDVENIRNPSATIYAITETVVVPNPGALVSLSCDAGDAAIGGKVSPNASMVSLFQSGDHSGAFKAQIILNFADFEEPGPRSIEITAVCAHLPTDG